MDNGPITTEALDRTFITALLLTGSAQRAEAAVVEGIKATQRGKVSDETLLLQGTLSASIAAGSNSPRAAEQEHASSLLPVELRRVLRLLPYFRRGFVLRVLVGLSREVCARMLQIEIHQIDEVVRLAARALVRLSKRGRRDGRVQPRYETTADTRFARETMNSSTQSGTALALLDNSSEDANGFAKI
jgi:hypothetical protein